jgi:hypothetical protein
LVFKLRLFVGVNNDLSANGYSLVEQAVLYDDQLADLFANPRFYLDNLEFLPTYRVGWKNYRSRTPTIPYGFVKEKTDGL